MTEEKIKNRDADSQVHAKGIKAGMKEGITVSTSFKGPWIFIFITLAVFLSPIGEKFVGYLKFRANRTALQIKCDDRGQTNACIELSRLYYLNGHMKEARQYQVKVCDKFDHLGFCKEKIKSK